MYRVAINIDEVLVEFLKPMAQHNKLKLPSKPRYSYVYRNIFDLSQEESTKMVRDFYDSQTFNNLQPIHGSRAIVQMMRPKISKIYAITGRQKCVRHKTEDWLDDNFPRLFDDMILTNSYTPRQVCKADICSSLNIDTIIDDSNIDCGICRYMGINPIHFAGYDEEMYPWCYEDETSVTSWVELYKKNLL
tara:strand:- start:101 stop:670 length:570 start_codon:yes stop_codon:yes gene_type:complete